MDKVHEYLALAKKYHFWGVAAVVVIVGMVAWYLAYGALETEYGTNKSAIEQANSSISAVRNVSPHPNDEYTAGMAAYMKERRDSVLAAWQKMYQQQRSTILIWPAELQPDFIKVIYDEVLRDEAIEQVKPETSPERDIPRHLRERYRNYVTEELPKLAATVKTPWLKTAEGAGAPVPGLEGPGVVANAKDDGYLLDWNPTNQQALQERFVWETETPSTLQVLYAQEELWVLQALMNVIAKTNEPADARHKAAIHLIEEIAIGKMVGDMQGTITPYVKPLAPGGENVGGQVRPPAPPPAPPADPRLLGPGGAPVPSDDPADLRYVDDKYKPLTAEALKAATDAPTAENAYLAVAKRMPIRMRLNMDTRKLNKLLAECGNSPLLIEVRQVRINPGASVAGGAGNNPGRGFGQPGREGGGFVRPPPPRGGGLEGGGANQADANKGYDQLVEIYGIIYIFNPVNAKKLGTPEGESLEPVVAPEAPPMTPTDPMATPMSTPMEITPTTPDPMGAPVVPAPMVPAPMVPAPMVPAPMPAPMGAPAAPMPAVPMPAPPAVPAPMPPAGGM